MEHSSHFEVSSQIHNSSYSMHSAHSHSYYELYYLLEGECNFFLHDKIYRITSGTIVFVATNTLHKTTYLESSYHKRLYIEFTLDYVSDIIETIGLKEFRRKLANNFFIIPKEFSETIIHLFKTISTEHLSDSIYKKCATKLHFEELVLFILRNIKSLSYESVLLSDNNQINIADESIQTAMMYISKNYMKNVTLEEVARITHLNPSYFSKKFKNVNGFGFKEYLNSVRINHSEKLLLETDKSITTIAFECGYDNSNYFGDAFKHLNKISPTEFRRIKGNIKD